MREEVPITFGTAVDDMGWGRDKGGYKDIMMNLLSMQPHGLPPSLPSSSPTRDFLEGKLAD